MNNLKTIPEFTDYEISNTGDMRSKISGKFLKSWLDKKGYYRVGLYVNKKVKYQHVHRLVAMTFMQNFNTNMFVDHIDRNPLNNDISNLRLANPTESQQNRNSKKGSTSKYKGVSIRDRKSPYRASICVNKKRISIGSFLLEIDAAKAYNKAAIEYFGEFAVLNEV